MMEMGAEYETRRDGIVDCTNCLFAEVCRRAPVTCRFHAGIIEGLLERAAESTVFLSSHDLAEIESFASHVGYLESGKLLFSEDMTSLSTRFREIELTRDSDGPLLSPLPGNWLQLKTSGAVVRFVDSRFDEQTTPAEIQRLFGTVKDAHYRGLSLRAIFLAMAKKSEEV